MKLRRAPYLKTGKFRRKIVKIGEIEAHPLFENEIFSRKFVKLGALLTQNLTIFDENQ